MAMRAMLCGSGTTMTGMEVAALGIGVVILVGNVLLALLFFRHR
jgi:hypothetical protein